jgi:hypothetical protein
MSNPEEEEEEAGGSTTPERPAGAPAEQSAAVTTSSEFLNTDRLDKIAKVNAALLASGGTWVHRRKEVVDVLDETAVLRQVSVDFTLPETIDDAGSTIIRTPTNGDPVYCPPLFVLPKRHAMVADLMAFDLQDETGVSLPLMTRRDNACVSAETLVALSERLLNGDSLSPALANRLRNVAMTDDFSASVAAERARFEETRRR